MSIATYGTKVFTVSNKKIYTINSISFSQALDIETQEVEGKKPATYIKGIGLIPLSFGIDLDARFVDVKAEIDWWNNKLLSKTPEVFTLGGKVISKNRFLLTSVSVSDILQGKKGIILKAKLGLEFEEYASRGYKKAEKSNKKKSSGMTADDVKALEVSMK